MRKKSKSLFETGEIEIEFDSLNDEFTDAEDFDDASGGFADENDFDEGDEYYNDEDDYDESHAGRYGEHEYAEEYAEEYTEDEYYEEEYAEEQYSEEQYSEEQYFDDHVEYFYDDEFAGETEEVQETQEVEEVAEFGTRASARNARMSVEAAGGVRVHKKPIVSVEEPARPARRTTAARPMQYRNKPIEDEDIQDDYYEDEAEEKKSRKTSLGAMERLMIVLAACVVLALVVAGGYVLIKKPFNKPSSNINANGIAYNSELAGAGSQLAGISTIGGAGLQSAYNEKMGGTSGGAVVDVVIPEENQYQEVEYTNEVEIAFETVSVVKDLKIKIVNKNTGKLIANVPFVVTVTTPSGAIQTWTDSDKDGVIYYSDIAAGSYKLHLEALDTTKYAGYVLPSDAKPDVRSEIAYERVNVADEILGAGDVNEATEDTARDGADSGSGTLADTVTYVASSTANTYVAITDKNVINMPFSLANLDCGNSIVMVAEGEVQGDPGTQTASGSVTCADSVSVKVGESSSVDVTVTTTNAAAPAVSAAVSGTAATAEYSSGKLTVKGVSAGTATVTLTLKDGETVLGTKTVNVTVTETVKGSISLAGTTLGVLSGRTASVQATLTGITSADVTVTSSNSAVATATIGTDGKITVTGVAAGTANIVITQSTDTSVTATLAVTVYATTNKLTATVNGKTVQLYVKEDNGNYREACYIDCTANPFPTFYYANSIYTGWQTIDGKTYYYTSDGKPVTGEQVINGVLYNFDNTGAMVVGSGTLGIDVSKWNGDINWSKVKAAGVSYVIIRIGYRGSTLGGLIDDANFKKNIEGAQAAGLKIGVYFVTQAINDAEAVYEASMVLDRISGYTISYPVFLDVEASGGRGDKIDVATRTSVCKTFCKTIQNAGYTAGIYANKSWLTTKIDASQLTGYKIWVAQYNSTCTYTGSYSMWQYTDKGTIDGISGKVDLNKSYLGY